MKILESAPERYERRNHFDGCFKPIQSILPTYPHKRKSRKNKIFSFSYSGLTIRPTYTHSKKEKFFENELDFLLFFAIILLCDVK